MLSLELIQFFTTWSWFFIHQFHDKYWEWILHPPLSIIIFISLGNESFWKIHGVVVKKWQFWNWEKQIRAKFRPKEYCVWLELVWWKLWNFMVACVNFTSFLKAFKIVWIKAIKNGKIQSLKSIFRVSNFTWILQSMEFYVSCHDIF